jgi:hypothetical protein
MCYRDLLVLLIDRGASGGVVTISKTLLRKYNSRDMYFRYLAGITSAFHTAFTYHRTWETGLEEVTRVSSSNPSFLR